MQESPNHAESNVVSADRRRIRQELLATPARELIRLFRDLPPPTLEEMHGELRATLLDQGSTVANLFGRTAIHAPGSWLAKAFEPLSSGQGHGYNAFRVRRGVRRMFRMRTFVGPSRLDEGHAYHLDYSAFNWGPMGTMWDEVRKLDDDIYLGLGRVGYTKRQRRHLMPFLLEGPADPFVPPERW
ncbi:MAG: hypothetical protein ACOCXM_11590 [Myxococcota bacterium]